MNGAVVVLAGGTGGAKLARGMLDVVGPDRLVVIANTGDDIEIHGGYVSPDVDLVTFWLADRIDDRGWGLAGDSWQVMDGLRDLGDEIWFSLGDRDLAIALWRARELRGGARPTEIQGRLGRALGVDAAVLPMSDQPVRTRVIAGERSWPFQEFMIRARSDAGWPEVQAVEFRGASSASATPEVLDALATAQAIVIGPSNPIISIGAILAVDEIRRAVTERRAPVVAVSPIASGTVLKGPTATFMRAHGLPVSAEGVARAYDGLLDGLVSDEPAGSLAIHLTDVVMDGAPGRRRLAEETLAFAARVKQDG
jgi:LPPG:FO 2-phospho-L-lactate transferase